MDDMREYRLPRDGDVPLVFRGELVSDGSSRGASGPAYARWHRIAIYRTEDGDHVVAIDYRTQCPGERSCRRVIQLGPDPAEVPQLLWRCVPPGLEVPAGAEASAEQDESKVSLRQRWDALVAQLLGGFDIVNWDAIKFDDEDAN